MKRFTVHQRASFLGDVVFAASDGIVTTFAIVAGSFGASFSSVVILTLGFANLIADGISMASGKYMGVKSEIEYEEAKGKDEDETSPLGHGVITFISFTIAGLFPLLPYLFRAENAFTISVILVGFSLFLVGSIRSRLTKKSYLASGVESLLVGGFAAFTAFLVGFLLDKYVV